MALILASSSAIRRAMLDAAGVDYDSMPPRVDEDAIKSQFQDAESVAGKLAEAKACDVSRGRESDWVVGSDSVVSVGGRLFDKPRSRDEAADHLRLFSGKQMRLTSAVAIARTAEIQWAHVDTAILHVRSLSDTFIETYLGAEWPEVGHCVGVFRMEGRGVQLFDGIEGDYFTILGMPLVPLLGALRERGLVRA